MASSSLSSSPWTPQENILFEKALARFDKDTPDRWHNIAQAIGGGKSAEEVRSHFEILMEDLRQRPISQLQRKKGLFQNLGWWK